MFDRHRNQKRQQGFTLVELAIVLMIIGLLIGGVLRGQEMYNNAKLQSMIKQVNSYEAAFTSFVDTYSNYPGDMALATTKIPNCNAGNHCANGNGDSKVGPQICAWCNLEWGVTTENAQFFKQLALAHLITGIDPSTDKLEWGRLYPKVPLNGGFVILTADIPPGWAAGTGVMRPGSFVLTTRGNLDSAVGNEQTPIVSAHQAAYIDRKMDDGLPDTGTVQSNFANGQFPDAGCEGQYNETQDKPVCQIMFIIHG